MKPISEMTPDEKRVAIATACGKKPMMDMCPECWGSGRLGGEGDSWECPHCKDGKVKPYYNGSDYLADLNAIHEAISILTPEQTWTAIVYLTGFQPAPSGFPLLSKFEAILLANASASAWADAFLAAIGHPL